MNSKERRLSIEQLLDGSEAESAEEVYHNTSQSHGNRWTIAIACSALLNVALLFVIVTLFSGRDHLASPLPPWPSTLYSPAQGVVEYETAEFVTNLRADMKQAEKNVYLELTDEGDAAWDLLTEEYATSAIPASDALRLKQSTAKSPYQPDLSLVGLSVFHQLHCLSRIRRLLYPERYNSSVYSVSLSSAEIAVHDAHCLDLLRQTLMCHADISPVTWKWNAKMGMALPNAKSMHVCRKWKPIWDWAVDHKAVGMS